MVAQQNTSAVPVAASVPTPGFEGFEKRLEVEFLRNDTTKQSRMGLRALQRPDIDKMLTAAECTIVSQLSSSMFDSYVLSESSLFIYPHKVVIKTCGTTQLLKAIPELLAAASKVGLTRVVRCKYTRGSFLFPDAQPFPHRDFDEEVHILEEHFGKLGNRRAFVMGDGKHKWHVYVAAEGAGAQEPVQKESNRVFTLEVCMTELDRDVAAKFFQSPTIQTGEDMTRGAGIQLLLPKSQICDFAFQPCGYSMNGVEGGAHSTIHITPEDGFSYASFECMGYDAANTDLNELISRVLHCFKPGFLSISVHAGGLEAKREVEASSWSRPISVPAGYVCNGSSRQDLPGESSIVYHTFRPSAAKAHAATQSSLPLSHLL